MTALTGRTPAASYKDLLQLPNGGLGLDATLRRLEDGGGVQAPMMLSTLEARANIPIMLAAPYFHLTNGSPSYGVLAQAGNRGAAVWLLDDTSVEAIGAMLNYRGVRSGSTIYVHVLFAMVSATTGNVVFDVTALPVIPGEDATAVGANHTQAVAVPNAVGKVAQADFTLTTNYENADWIRLSVERSASNASDTAVGDCMVAAVVVRFA